jgi:predicted amidophosphoribosyltransferase
MARGKCTNCEAKVPMYAPICPNCGLALNWNGPGVKEVKATCPSCGRYTTSASSTCVHCGTPINWQVTTFNRSQAKLTAVGSGLQTVGCLLTLFVTIPVILIIAFVAC